MFLIVTEIKPNRAFSSIKRLFHRAVISMEKESASKFKR